MANQTAIYLNEYVTRYRTWYEDYIKNIVEKINLKT